MRAGAKGVGLLAGATAALALAGTALAAGNSVHVTAPSDVHVDQPFSVTVHGFATHAERLYLFLDHHKCGANPAVEHHRANGVIWKRVKGSFSLSSNWTLPSTGVWHNCVYLQRRSVPKNSKRGVLARGSSHYRVH